MAVNIETTPGFRGIAHSGSLMDELILYFPFNEGIGSTITDVYGGNTGDITTGNASFSLGSKLGLASIESDSYNDYVMFGDENTYNNVYDKISISYWAKVDTLPSALGRLTYHYAMWDSTRLHVLTGIYHGTDNRIYFFMQSFIGEANTIYTYSDPILETTEFFHVCCVARGIGQSMRIYINGLDSTQVNRTPAGPLYRPLGPNSYLLNSGGSYAMDGRIDELGIWSRALTLSDSQTLYNNNNGLTFPFNS